jgi:hypothetical protein
MAWIESHTTLREHPKTKRLCRLLGINRREAIGLLHFLWWWAIDFAPEGDLSDFSDEDIADSIDWVCDAQQLIVSLTQAGFVDKDRRIHDWDEFAEKWIARRRANSERMRVARADRNGTAHSKGAAHVHDTSGARATQKAKSVGLPDQPDQPDQPDRIPPQPPLNGGASAAARRTHAQQKSSEPTMAAAPPTSSLTSEEMAAWTLPPPAP